MKNIVQLKELSGLYSIYKLKPNDIVPSSVYQSEFLSITCTDEELSIVCRENSDIKSEFVSHHWRCLKINEMLEFSMIGIIHQITTVLKSAQISVFVVSTYNTDYFLIQQHQFDRAVEALKQDSQIKF